ncbi:MAG: DUF302 domain-containing protein [Kangiellaceae bacterium]|jgi:uncharacterized protein (DUF302 family)|nr:DUF302 domain-containing protein [Kangiellaceae bacterium]
MIKQNVLGLVLLLTTNLAISIDGLIAMKSDFSVVETADRLEKVLTANKLTVFNRIKHSDAANKVGVALRPTELVIFGNPKVGSPLMACQQSVAIDLPQKSLIWQDENGQVWIGYNDPMYLKSRHDIEACEPSLAKISKALAAVTAKASKKAQSN